MRLVVAVLIALVVTAVAVAAMLWCAARPPTAATSTTATAPPACSACSRPGSRCCSASSCSSPSRATTRPCRRRDGGADRRAAGRDGAVLPPPAAAELDRRAGLLRPLGRRRAVGHDGEPARSAKSSTRGARSCSRRCGRSTRQTPTRAGGLRQVARPAVGPRGSAQRPHPRRGRRDPDAAVARAVLHLRRDLRSIMLFFADSGERARRPGDADGHGGRGDHVDAAAARRARPTRSTRASAVCARSPWSGR